LSIIGTLCVDLLDDPAINILLDALKARGGTTVIETLTTEQCGFGAQCSEYLDTYNREIYTYKIPNNNLDFTRKNCKLPVTIIIIEKAKHGRPCDAKLPVHVLWG